MPFRWQLHTRDPASVSHPRAGGGTRGPWGAYSQPPPAPGGRYCVLSLWWTRTKQVAKKWCHCVMSNLWIIKILFDGMSQEASGPVSQAGTAEVFWPSMVELDVSLLRAPAGIAAMGQEPLLPKGTEGCMGLPSPMGHSPTGGGLVCVAGGGCGGVWTATSPCAFLEPVASVSVQERAVRRPRRYCRVVGTCPGANVPGTCQWSPSCRTLLVPSVVSKQPNPSAFLLRSPLQLQRVDL